MRHPDGELDLHRETNAPEYVGLRGLRVFSTAGDDVVGLVGRVRGNGEWNHRPAPRSVRDQQPPRRVINRQPETGGRGGSDTVTATGFECKPLLEGTVLVEFFSDAG